eukprot:g12112.t1
MVEVWCALSGIEHTTALARLQHDADAANIRQGHPLHNLLKIMHKGQKRLPNTRFTSSQALTDIGCKHTWIVKRQLCICEITRQGASCLQQTRLRTINVTIYGEHDPLCMQYASEYKIPQELSPRLHCWIQNALRGGVDISAVCDALVSEHHEVFSLCGPPPRPSCAWKPEYIRCSAFSPSADMIRNYVRDQNAMWSLDKDDFIATRKLLAGTANVKHQLRQPKCDCPRPHDKRQHDQCVNRKCFSFRSMWMAPWQKKFLEANKSKRTFFLDGTGQVNQYGYMLYTIMMISTLFMYAYICIALY